jgi:hypothetical protein
VAVGDVVSDKQSIATGAFLTIQPSAGVEWQINNLYHQSACELYFSDVTDDILIDSHPGAGRWSFESLRANNTIYFKLKNLDPASKVLGYDGVRTK